MRISGSMKPYSKLHIASLGEEVITSHAWGWICLQANMAPAALQANALHGADCPCSRPLWLQETETGLGPPVQLENTKGKPRRGCCGCVSRGRVFTRAQDADQG